MEKDLKDNKVKELKANMVLSKQTQQQNRNKKNQREILKLKNAKFVE